MLSTFRLIEEENETADWETYRNEEIGNEFKYPPNFEYRGEEGQIWWTIFTLN